MHDIVVRESTIIPESEFPAPSLLEYTKNVISQINPKLQQIAEQAIGTRFNPENSPPVMMLASNSFKEQLAFQTSKDPSIVDRFSKFGIGAVIDSNKLLDVNILTSSQFGDSYVLKNMESIMTFAKEENMDVMLGRYSGDEILTFFVPHEERNAEEVMQKFTAWNRKFLSQKDPVNDKLNPLLPELQKIHGKDFEIGASIKAINLKEVTFTKKDNIRERELLGDIIDAIEHKIIPGKDNLSDELLTNMMIERRIAYAYKEIPWFPELLPYSVLDLFTTAIRNGADPAEAGAYAEDAAFESLYPRLSVYRMEVFEEMSNKFKKQGEVILVKSADPYMKWTNKNVAHSAGDERMLGLANHDFVKVAYLASFQHNGSLLHLITASHIETHNRQIAQIVDSQPDEVLDTNNRHPETFRVVTSEIQLDDGTTTYARINNETTSEVLWGYVDMLRDQQANNEIGVLITRAGAHFAALDNLIQYLTVRINRLESAIKISGELKQPLPAETQSQVEQALKSLQPVSP